MPVSRVHYNPGPNPNMITEGDRPGKFVVSLYHESYCHENLEVEGGVSGVANNSVLADLSGDFAGILYEGVRKGETTVRAVLVRGPAEVSERWLVFPTAVDGADSGSDATAETAALKASLIADMKAAGIVVRA